MLKRPDWGFGLKDPMQYELIDTWVFSKDGRYVTELLGCNEEPVTAILARKADIMEVSTDSEFNRPVRPGTTQDGTGRCHAVRPRVGRKRCRLFEAGRGRTERTAGDGEEPSPVVIHRYPWILVYITKLICKTE